MKPLYLTMSAFGTYKDQTAIDFTRLGNEGIFLITGSTGAGKTTIFDAICYALFGQTSSERRAVKMLASDFVGEGTSPEVELVFSHRGEKYTIQRRQAYTRHRDGTVEMRQQQATLTLPDGRLLDKLASVNQAIGQDILHLTYEQFKQIAMIAQGEFRELLEADTEKRSEILQKIFQTEGYRRLAAVLKEKADAAKMAAKESAQSIVQYFREAKAAPESAFFKELAELQGKYTAEAPVDSLDEMLALLDNLTAEDSAREKALAAEIGTAEEANRALAAKVSQAEEMNERLKERDALRKKQATLIAKGEAIGAKRTQLAEEIKAVRLVGPLYESWRREKAALVAAEEKERAQAETLKRERARAEAAKAAAEKADSRRPEMEGREREVAALREQEPIYAERARQQTELRQAKERAATLEEEQQAREKTLNAVKAAIADEEAKQAGKTALSEQRAETRLRAERLAENHQEAGRLITEDIPTCRLAIDDWKKKGSACTAAQGKFDAVRVEYEAIERRLEDSRAGLLAEKLETGKPCPVCGALTHPHPAALSADSVSEAEGELWQKKLEAARQEKDSAVSAAAEARSTCETLAEKLRRDIGSFLEKLGEQGDIVLAEYRGAAKENTSLEELFTLMETVRARLKEAEKAVRQEAARQETEWAALKEGESRLKREKERQKEIEEKAQQAAQAVLLNGKAEAAAEAALAALPELPYATLEKAREAREAKEKEAGEWRAAIERTEKERQSAESRRVEAQAKLEQAVEQAATERESAAKSGALFHAALEEQGFAEAAFTACYTNEASITALQQEIERYDQEVTATKSQLSVLERQTKEVPNFDIKALTSQLEERRQALEETRKAHNAVYNRCEQNRTLADRLRGADTENQARRHRAALLQSVSERVGGKAAGRRTTLEEYVQSAGFARIVDAADVRLGDMTGGRFSLAPHEAQADDDKRMKHGLSLDVLDRYTGRRRSVKTLSGGESFLASLALALGLSDTVTENAGGVAIETLFIDEGFGTLDPEALQSAVELLQGLTANGKLIGIISHREELKQALPRQLIVEKSRHGSRVRVETDI